MCGSVRPGPPHQTAVVTHTIRDLSELPDLLLNVSQLRYQVLKHQVQSVRSFFSFERNTEAEGSLATLVALT